MDWNQISDFIVLDPHCPNFVDPDPHSINADPHHNFFFTEIKCEAPDPLAVEAEVPLHLIKPDQDAGIYI